MIYEHVANGVKSSSIHLTKNVSPIQYSYHVNYVDCVRLL